MTSDYKIEPKLWVVERKNRNGWRPIRCADTAKDMAAGWMAGLKHAKKGEYRMVKYVPEKKR